MLRYKYKVKKIINMEYLRQVIGINVKYGDEIKELFPNYVTLRYKMRFASLDDVKVVFVYPQSSLDAISIIKKHFDIIKTETNCIPVLILEQLSSRNKLYLIKEKIPFIVEYKQIYLPFMATYLNERGDGERINKEKLLPSSQLLLLYYIYKGCGELMTSKAVKDLNFTPMSISRASKQLAELGLVKVKKQGVQKIIFSTKNPKELFDESKKYMLNPIKKTIYISKDNYDSSFLYSGLSALSYYSNINSSLVAYYATSSISKYEKEASNRLVDSNEQIALELWRYDPHKISKDNYVDKLSLVLSFMDNKDERIEQAIEEMLNDVWSEIDGKRN